MSFVHLHTHSHYSLLDGLGKIDDLVAKAVEYQMPALALTDHGVMYGAIEFYKKCKKAGIKPILGVEVYVAPNRHTDKRPKIDERPYHLILLAQNETGYQNLVKLTTIAHLEGFYYKPRIDFELLQKHHEGLICSTACLAGELARNILADNEVGAREMIARYQALFGVDNFYLEVQNHPNIPQQAILNEAVFRLGAELQVPIIATNDIHYPNKDDDYAQDVLLCIQTKKVLSDTDRMSYIGNNFSFKSPAEMAASFPDHPEVVANTLKIAEMCNLELKMGVSVLPEFPLPEGVTVDEHLKIICEEGLIKRYTADGVTPEISERLRYELDIITKTGYAGYFLIVSDFINWAKNNGVIVGPGRGSAAGSLVAYLSGITNIDPIRYNLVFERFLNPERISMPDIDTDFADTRRDDVLRYVSEKYGKDRVAQIITFGTMAARASIRDVGRAMGVPYSYCDRVAKLIPMMTKLDKAIETVPELKAILEEEQGKKLLATARRLEGVVRHASTHACGVVITPQSLDLYSPRQHGSHGDDSIVVQYEMHAVEDLGLLKMDFLGLSNLTIIEQALEIIEKIHGIRIDIDTIPLDDQKAFKLFQDGRTTGVFQFESAGMKRYLKQLGSTDIEDIIAMVALYRPGPMEYIPDYIAGKQGKRKPKYLHPKLKPILEGTYGVAVYQEQLLQIARDLAGFSYGEADILRKAVGKKIAELLKEQEVKMISGMSANGIDAKVAKKIWEFILPFASYGFNRSHAACYALIGYQTAYLKANYPAEFMAALLTSDQGNSDRIAIEAEECRQMGIEVLPPDVNESYSTFTVVAESLQTDRPRIRFGLMAVKGLGEHIVKVIIKERKDNGKFADLEEFLRRVNDKDLNKRSLEAMIKSGCLDCFGERQQLLASLEQLLMYAQESRKEGSSGQHSMFGMFSTPSVARLQLAPTEPLDKRQRLNFEKQYLGLYVSEHPMQEMQKLLTDFVIGCHKLKHCVAGTEVRVAGIISKVKRIITKKGDAMLFVKIEDSTSDVELLVFPKVLEQYPHLWQEDSIIVCSGKISDKDDEVKILCDKAAVVTYDNIDQVRSLFAQGKPGMGMRRSDPPQGKKVELHVPTNLDYEISKQLYNLMYTYPGTDSLVLVVISDSGQQKMSTSFKINGSENFIQAIKGVINTTCVVQ